jgi:hypothetical protein
MMATSLLIHRDHVHRVIGQTHVVSIKLINMHIVLPAALLPKSPTSTIHRQE